MREAGPLAAHLEEEVFPRIRDNGQKSILLGVDTRQGCLIHVGTEGRTDYKLRGTEALVLALSDFGVKVICLDTQLESNQFEDGLLVLLFVGKRLRSTDKPDTSADSDSWNIPNIVNALHSEEGLHKFCAQMRFDSDTGIYDISYSYCELFYSRFVNKWTRRFSHTQDHRFMFAAAPAAGLLTALGIFQVEILAAYFPDAAMALHVILAISLGICMSLLIFTIGSIQYDREHRDSMLKETMKEIRDLSDFPMHNPNLILKMNTDGDVLYHNPATGILLKKMHLPESSVLDLLPGNYLDKVRECIINEEHLGGIEVEKNGVTIRYRFSHFHGEDAVLIAGTDVSRMKQLESDLMQWNQKLEKRVLDRTKELVATQDVTIITLSALAETRDPETGEHIERTRLYVRLLATYLRFSEEYRDLLDSNEVIDLLYRSAPLHDIGKVGVPDSILLKPGKLTTEEFSIMQKHAVYGGDALHRAQHCLGANSFLKMAQEIAYNHHEKWDGSGYPNGLSGRAIPIPARIMALADVYDALTSKRPYKEAFSHEKARAIILDGSGTHFDPVVVEKFLEAEDQFLIISQEHRELTMLPFPHVTSG